MRLIPGTLGTSIYNSGGGTTGMYGIPYTTQNHTIIIFKLLIKLYTTVLLFSIMLNLQVPGSSFASMYFQLWKLMVFLTVNGFHQLSITITMFESL